MELMDLENRCTTSGPENLMAKTIQSPAMTTSTHVRSRRWMKPTTRLPIKKAAKRCLPERFFSPTMAKRVRYRPNPRMAKRPRSCTTKTSPSPSAESPFRSSASGRAFSLRHLAIATGATHKSLCRESLRICYLLPMRFSVLFVLLLLISVPLTAKDKDKYLKPGPIKLDKDGEKWAEKTLKKMTLEEKVGQMFMVWTRVTFHNVDSADYKKL